MVPGMGLGKCSQEGTLYGWLTVVLGGYQAKEHPCCHGCGIYRGGSLKQDPSNDICSVITPCTPSTRSLGQCILHDILGNACWQKHQKMFPRLTTINYIIYGSVTKTGSLSNECTCTYQCGKVSCTVQGQFHCYTYSNLFNMDITVQSHP